MWFLTQGSLLKRGLWPWLDSRRVNSASRILNPALNYILINLSTGWAQPGSLGHNSIDSSALECWERVTTLLILNISSNYFWGSALRKANQSFPYSHKLCRISTMSPANPKVQPEKESSCKHQLKQREKFQNLTDFRAGTVTCVDFNSQFKRQIFSFALGVAFPWQCVLAPIHLPPKEPRILGMSLERFSFHSCCFKSNYGWHGCVLNSLKLKHFFKKLSEFLKSR